MLVGAAFLVVGGIIGGIVLREALNTEDEKIRSLSERIRLLGAGDTPVVLIGDSLKFKQKDSQNKWKSSGVGYSLDLGTPVSAIVLKRKGVTGHDDDQNDDKGDDKNVLSDSLSFDISRLDPTKTFDLEIDEFTTPTGPAVTSITTIAGSNQLVLMKTLAAGTLCFNEITIHYITNADCTHKTKANFDRVSLTITENIGGTHQAVATETISCYDENNTAGVCRIVFRE